MSDVFISYAQEDSAVMRSLAKGLVKNEFLVWTASKKLTPGTREWSKVIEKAIEDARHLVVLLTPAAKQSEWVSLEVAYARAFDTTILPWLARGSVQTSVPIELIRTQWIDATRDYPAALTELIEELHRASLATRVRIREDSPPEEIQALLSKLSARDRFEYFDKVLATSMVSAFKAPHREGLSPREEYQAASEMADAGVREWAERKGVLADFSVWERKRSSRTTAGAPEGSQGPLEVQPSAQSDPVSNGPPDWLRRVLQGVALLAGLLALAVALNLVSC